MRKSAIKRDDGDHDVVHLDNDERWQERLAEARARRAIALQEKEANGDSAPMRRAKPWEDEQKPLPTIVEAPRERDSNGEIRKDFADRVDAIRAKALSDEEAAPPPPPSEAETAPESTAARVAASDPGSRLERLPELKPVDGASAFEAAGRSDAAEETSDAAHAALMAHAATLRPEADKARVGQDAQLAAAIRDASEPEQPRGRPRILAFGLLALALTPFLHKLPPMETGPAAVATPYFGLEPALGLTAPNVAPPVATRAGEWRPVSNTAPVPPIGTGPARAPVLWPGLPGLPAAPDTEMLEFTRPALHAGAGHATTPGQRLAGGTIEAMPNRLAAPQRIEVASDAPRLPQYDEPALLVSDAAFGEAATPDQQVQISSTLSEEGVIEPTGAVHVSLPSIGDAPAAAPVQSLRVTVLVPERGDEAAAADVADDIQSMGHDLARIQVVNLTISERNVRYFHEADRHAASRIAELHDARLRDFTSFRPSPARGTVEVWLSGKSLERPPVVATARPARQATAPVIVQRVETRRRGLLGWLSNRFDGDRRSASGTRTSNSERSGSTTLFRQPRSEAPGTATAAAAAVSETVSATRDSGGTAVGDTSAGHEGETTTGGTAGTTSDTGSGTTTSGDTTSTSGSGSSGSDTGSESTSSGTSSDSDSSSGSSKSRGKGRDKKDKDRD